MAAPPPPPPPQKGGLSLYDHLLDPNEKPATISSAPVLYNSDSTAEPSPAAAKKPIDPALRFQPIRRPQLKTAKPKSAPKPPPAATQAQQQQPPPPPPPPSAPASDTKTSAAAPTQQPQKSTLADWAATEEDEWRYGVGEKRQRGGRKKKKKQHHPVETDWDDIYDPTRPTNVDEYLRSDEKIDEVREWKALLYRHRREKEQQSDPSDDSEADSRPRPSNQFAPPPSYNFAPPPQSPPAPPPESLPPPPPEDPPTIMNPTGTISAAPIRYNQTKTTDREDEPYSPPPASGTSPPPQTSLPGQANFASRLMKKYGWTSGTGLGASSSGIINPLHVKVEKRKKRSDAEGGGWADPANKGKILGGQRAAAAAAEGTQDSEGRGKMSEVIVLENMLENMPDLQEEISAGLGQEIGEECGEKYGRVERLYIDQDRRLVFIKFTDQISALRAVTELDGRVFNGNTIRPRYYDADKFERGVYG